MGDDDQLRGLLKLLEDGEQARQVHVVQGGLDLVHDVERGRARLKDRDQERDRGQGTLAARQQRQALNLLARGPSLNLDARRQHVVRVGEHQVAHPAREQHAEDVLELLARLGERRREGLLHQAIHVLHDAQQVRLRCLEILDLVHQELVPRGQRLVLLERQRVDAPQLLQVLQRLGQGPLLLGAHVRARLRGSGLVDLIRVERQHRHQHLRAELGEQLLGFEGQLLEGATLQVLDAQARLLGRDLPLVGRGRGFRQLCAQPVQGAACVRDLLGDLRAPLAQTVALRGGLSEGTLGCLEGHAGGGLHVRGRGQLRLSRGLAPGVAGALLALGGSSLAQGAGA